MEKSFLKFFLLMCIIAIAKLDPCVERPVDVTYPSTSSTPDLSVPQPGCIWMYTATTFTGDKWEICHHQDVSFIAAYFDQVWSVLSNTIYSIKLGKDTAILLYPDPMYGATAGFPLYESTENINYVAQGWAVANTLDSVRILRKGCIQVFSLAGYLGSNKKTCRNDNTAIIAENTISSVFVGPDTTVTFYSGSTASSDLTSSSITLTESRDDLSDPDLSLDNTIGFYRIKTQIPTGCIWLYDISDFQLDTFNFAWDSGTPGNRQDFYCDIDGNLDDLIVKSGIDDVHTLDNWFSWDEEVMGISMGKDTKIIVYSEKDFKGDFMIINGEDFGDLSDYPLGDDGNNWGNEIRSIKTLKAGYAYYFDKDDSSKSFMIGRCVDAIPEEFKNKTVELILAHNTKLSIANPRFMSAGNDLAYIEGTVVRVNLALLRSVIKAEYS